MKSEPARKRSPEAQEENRRNRRQFIMDEAAKLFAENGYQATTMDQLSAVTGLNKGTVYYYYKAKSEILYDISVSISAKSLKLISPAIKMAHASDGLAHAIDVIVPWIVDHRNAVTAYFQESPYFVSIFTPEQNNVIRKQQKSITGVFYKIIESGIRSGEFADHDVTKTGRLIVGMLMWIYRWPEPNINSDEVSEAVKSLIMNGLERPTRDVKPKVVVTRIADAVTDYK